MSTADYLNQLITDRNNLADNLTSLGASSTHSETFTELTPKVLSIKNILQNLNVIKNASGQSLNLSKVSNGVKGRLNVDGFSRQNTVLLPEGYQQVDYIESHGTEYIDTGIVGNQNTAIEIISAYTNYTNEWRSIIGGREQYNGNWIEIHQATNNRNTRADFGTIDASTVSNIVYTNVAFNDYNKHKYKIEDFNVYVDGQKIGECSNKTNFSTVATLYLFANNQNGVVIEQVYAKIYSCKIYDNNTLVRDFIPCYRKSDNEVGMYDLVNGVFYTNAGTGSFTYGAITSTPSPDYPSPIRNLEGKNLFDGVLRNGIYNSNTGEFSSHSDYLANTNIIKVKPNTNYIISDDLGYSYEAYLYNKDRIFIGRAFAVNNKFSTDSNTNYINWRTLTEGQNSLQAKVQLEEGTVATDYVPYNTLRFKQRGKNLVDSTLTTLQSNNTSGTWNNGAYTLNGITFTPVYNNNQLQYINVNGTANDASVFQLGKITPPTTSQIYTLNGCPSGGSPSSYRLWLDYVGGDYGSGITGAPGVTSILNCFMKVENGVTVSNLQFKPMVVLGSTLGEYEPYYTPQIIDFPLSAGQKMYEGSKLTPQGIYNERGQDVLENIAITKDHCYTITSTIGADLFGFVMQREWVIPYTSYSDCNILCDSLQTKYLGNASATTDVNNVRYNEGISAHSGSSTQQLCITLKKDRLTSIDLQGAVDVLNEIKPKVEYELKTPTITQYTEAQAKAYNELSNCDMYNGTNIIELDSNEATTIYAEYGENAIEVIKEGITA